MTQSADTRQWEQQVRLPVVPTADLTKSSTQSGAGFINCTFYDVEDSFGKRTFVNKRPGFQYTSSFTGGAGLTGKTTRGFYWNLSGGGQYYGTLGGINQYGQTLFTSTADTLSFQSSDIVLVRNGAVELRQFQTGGSPSGRYRIHEFEFRYDLRTGGTVGKTWKSYTNDSMTFGTMTTEATSMYPVGMVCFDVIATGSGPYGYDFHQWVSLTGGWSVTDGYGKTWTAVIGGATWPVISVATYATYTAGSTVVADSLGNQWLYTGRTRSIPAGASGGNNTGWYPEGCGSYLNGYSFWVDTDGNIRNSILNYPMAFASLGYIQPASGEKLVTTAKVNNTLVVFSAKKTYFYSVGSAGNSGYQGSPLQPMPQATKDIGCAYANSVAEAEGMVALVAAASNGTKTVVAYNNTSYQEIGNDDITAILGDSTSYTDVHGWFLRTSRGLLYMMQLINGSSVVKTFVYSFDNGVWGQWNSTTTGGVETVFRPKHKTRSYDGTSKEYYVDVSGQVYNMVDIPRDNDGSAYRDYTMQIRTPKLDFGSTRYKFMNWISIATEQRTYNADTGQMNIRVGFEDDNGVVTYLNSTPNPTYDGNWLRWTRCGRFRRRRIIIDNSDQYCPVFSNIDVGFTLGER